MPIWQPPLGSGETSGAGSQTVTPGTAPVTDLSTSDVKRRPRLVQAQSPDPTTSFSTEFDAAAAAPVPMQPGFVITGQGIDDGSPAILITLDARNKDSSILSRRLVLRIPEAMATRVGIETPSGVEPVSKWLEEAKSTMVSAPGAVGSGTDEIQLRVKSVAFPGDVPGIAVDIGNMAEPVSGDFLIAIREVTRRSSMSRNRAAEQRFLRRSGSGLKRMPGTNSGCPKQSDAADPGGLRNLAGLHVD